MIDLKELTDVSKMTEEQLEYYKKGVQDGINYIALHNVISAEGQIFKYVKAEEKDKDRPCDNCELKEMCDAVNEASKHFACTPFNEFNNNDGMHFIKL